MLLRDAHSNPTLAVLAYNQCTKLKEVPTPFAYVQLNATLLLIFNLITPIILPCA